MVSRDSQVQTPVAKVFTDIDLRVREDTLGALELISRSHFDAFVIDCDGMRRGTGIIVAVRNSPSNRRAVIFSIVTAKTPVATAMECGSNFVLGKPVDAERLSTYFDSSLHKMETEHRRYFRYQLTLDAKVENRDGRVLPAQILNVSERGVALRRLDGAQLHGSATIRFVPPNGGKKLITAVAIVCWSREPIFGMKLFGMDEESRSAYTEWLSSMALV